MAAVYSDDNEDVAAVPVAKKQRSTLAPSSFVTWNCNGLPMRAKRNVQELHQLVTSTSSPDVICMQEVHMKATSPTRRGEPCREDLGKVQPLFETGGPFSQYDTFWSLKDTRHSGTLTLIHKRLGGIGENMAVFSNQGATDLFLNKYSMTRKDVGLAESSSSSPAKQQTSIKSFFSATSNQSRASTSTQEQHHQEGRFQFFSFPEMDIMHTYVPNHGTKAEHFQRRKEWDDETLEFIQNRKAILEKAGCSNRKLLWVGDMNVARDYRDGTHWKTTDEGVIEEWWTNERKCFVRPGDPNRSPQHRGMPSFTPAERTRFNNIMKQGDLVDIWREMHPQGSTSHGHLSTWERPDYTWRGHTSKNADKKAKYEGRGQRLDYFLTNSIPMENVKECDILGYGTAQERLFCGSDHCAVKVVFRK